MKLFPALRGQKDVPPPMPDNVATKPVQIHPVFEAYTTEVAPDARQQGKLIAAFLDSNPDKNIAEVSSEQAQALTPEDRADFLNKVRSGEISIEQIQQKIRGIAPAILKKGREEIFASIRQQYDNQVGQQQVKARRMLSVVEIVALRTTGHYLHITDETLGVAYNKASTPWDFERAASGLVIQVNRTHGEQKAREYRAAVTETTKAIFGKQAEYWEQAKLLMQEAGS